MHRRDTFFPSLARQPERETSTRLGSHVKVEHGQPSGRTVVGKPEHVFVFCGGAVRAASKLPAAALSPTEALALQKARRLRQLQLFFDSVQVTMKRFLLYFFSSLKFKKKKLAARACETV